MGIISGIVLDENGDPLADCVVCAWRRDTRGLTASVVTDTGTGAYSISRCAGTPHDIVAFRDGYRPLAHGPVDPIITPGDIAQQHLMKLHASDAAASDYFGNSVALNSDATIALIGASGDDDTASASGSVYVFTRSGEVWTQQQKIHASDAASSDTFGSSVAMNADATIALIGAANDSDTSTSSGSVYVFTRSGDVWTQQQKLHASDPNSFDYFGKSVALNSDATIALIGATGDDDTVSGSGSVYVFTRSGAVWTQQQKIHASDPASNKYFGSSVAMNSDATIALIGATGDNSGSGSGSVYVFTRSGEVWTQQQKLYASDAASNDNFGNSVALTADAAFAIIGALNDDNVYTDSGSVYIFSRSGDVWTEQQKIYATDAAASDYFGYSVALNSDATIALIGANSDDDTASASGSVYFYA